MLRARDWFWRRYLAFRRSKSVSEPAATDPNIRVYRYAEDWKMISIEERESYLETFHAQLGANGIEVFPLPAGPDCEIRLGTTSAVVAILEASTGKFDLTYEGISVFDGSIPDNNHHPSALKLFVHPLDSRTNQPLSPFGVLEILPSSDGIVVVDIPDTQSPVASLETFRDSGSKHSATRVEHSCIDAVITWVDGSDPVWREKFDFFQRDARTQTTPGDSHDADSGEPPLLASDALHFGRFTNSGELRYQLRALHTFLPWLRKIFVVTDGQIPDWYRPTAGSNVYFVSHSEIMEKEYLPTFNSHAIEASLRNLDDLSSKFIYFNDDMIPLRPIPRTNFFSPDGLPMVFPSRAIVAPQLVDWSEWQSPDLSQRLMSLIGADWGAINSARILSRHFGPIMPRKFRHAPYAANLSLVEEALDSAVEEVQQTISSRFRSRLDVATLSNLVPAWGLQAEEAIIGKDLRSAYLSGSSPSLSHNLASLLRVDETDLLCITDLENDEKGAFELFAEAVVPVPSPSEIKQVANT
jgi:hypothetical protein